MTGTKIFGRRGRLALLGVVAAGMFGGGCATDARLADTNQANRRLTERNQALVAELADARDENAQLRGDLQNRAGSNSDLVRTNRDLQNRLTAAQDLLRRFENRLGEVAFGPLDAATDAALAELAAQNSDLMTYDPDRGMIRLSSDLSFPSGSDQVQPRAVEGLSRLAGVLNSRSGLEYEIMIVGHTDSQNPSAATQRRHPTNMHLSAHRAIAVRGTLRNQGVPADRMFVAGWGEHRPIVPNNERGGTTENRRVELFLMRSTEGDFGTTASVPEPTEPAGTNTRAPGAGTEPVK